MNMKMGPSQSVDAGTEASDRLKSPANSVNTVDCTRSPLSEQTLKGQTRHSRRPETFSRKSSLGSVDQHHSGLLCCRCEEHFLHEGRGPSAG